MFYGCQNLTSLDLGLFNTNYIIGSRGSKSFSAYNVFTGCNKLTSITIGSNWYIPMGSEYANLPSLEDFGIRWQKNGEGYSTDSIPYYKSHDEPDNYGTFTRDPEEIERLRQTVSISSEDPSKGTVSSGSYMFYPNKPVCVNGSDNLIRLNDTTIIATPKEGYKFDYWTVGGWYYDNEECSFAKSFEIVAHFSPDGYSAKAVYTKNNSAYDNDNTLTFYYDNVDHSSEGTVYEVIPNTRADTYKGNAVLPS
ncbi:MAG: hypothetical protein Q4F54_04780 [Coriobacteriia bacterium]|nr:hypothetical protein [Coriobacteriia bacterium]